jgi:streptogramin lyase
VNSDQTPSPSPGRRRLVHARTKVALAVAVTSGFVFGATVVLSGATRAVFELTDSTAWVDNDGASSVTQLDPGGVAGTVPLGTTTGPITTIEIDGVPFAVDDSGIRRIDATTLSVSDHVAVEGADAPAVVGGAGRLYAIDRSTGTITEYDPDNLRQVGTPVTVGGVLGNPVVDKDGVLWVPQLDTRSRPSCRRVRRCPCSTGTGT